MHIPSSMLHGAVCPVTLAVAGAGIGWAAYAARKSPRRPSALRLAAVTALVFALQMLNYPVANGTSGHLLGAVLAVSLVGVPFAVLAMAAVLLVQAFLFGDGGILAVGANIINMSLIGAGATGWLYERLNARGLNPSVSLAGAAWFSMAAAAMACSLEVAWSGAVALGKVVPAMLSVHVLIGAGEALLTLLFATALRWAASRFQASERAGIWSASVLALLAVLASPWASTFPDGLERVAERLAFASFPSFSLPAWFADYQAPWLGGGSAATLLAGLAGVLAAAVLAGALSRLYRV
ncbi:MAG: energy-coupling factor ABC transporter permease [candidate division FCPU426 bacterium]